MRTWRGVRLRPLVVVLVPRGGGGSSGNIPTLTMPRARDFTSPQQLWDQEKRCEKASRATKEHDGV